MKGDFISNRRILICFSSVLHRYSNICFDSIISNLIKVNEGTFDIIGHSPPSANAHLIEDLRPYCQDLSWQFERDPIFSKEALSRTFKMEHYYNNLNNNLLQWHSQNEVRKMKDEIEKRKGPYDIVIWTRPDLFWALPTKLPLTIESNTLYISDYDHWSGINDRFCFGDSKSISTKLSIGNYFDNNWYDDFSKDPRRYLNERFSWCPELVLASLLDISGIALALDYSLPLRLKEFNNKNYVIAPGQYRSANRRWIFANQLIAQNGDQTLFNTLLSLLKKLENDRSSIMDPRRQNDPKHQVTKLAKIVLNRAGGLTPLIRLELIKDSLSLILNDN